MAASVNKTVHDELVDFLKNHSISAKTKKKGNVVSRNSHVQYKIEGDDFVKLCGILDEFYLSDDRWNDLYEIVGPVPPLRLEITLKPGKNEYVEKIVVGLCQSIKDIFLHKDNHSLFNCAFSELTENNLFEVRFPLLRVATDNVENYLIKRMEKLFKDEIKEIKTLVGELPFIFGIYDDERKSRDFHLASYDDSGFMTYELSEIDDLFPVTDTEHRSAESVKSMTARFSSLYGSGQIQLNPDFVKDLEKKVTSPKEEPKKLDPKAPFDYDNCDENDAINPLYADFKLTNEIAQTIFESKILYNMARYPKDYSYSKTFICKYYGEFIKQHKGELFIFDHDLYWHPIKSNGVGFFQEVIRRDIKYLLLHSIKHFQNLMKEDPELTKSGNDNIMEASKLIGIVSEKDWAKNLIDGMTTGGSCSTLLETIDEFNSSVGKKFPIDKYMIDLATSKLEPRWTSDYWTSGLTPKYSPEIVEKIEKGEYKKDYEELLRILKDNWLNEETGEEEKDVYDHTQRYLGACLVGSQDREGKIMFSIGSGSNGKSKFFTSVVDVFGSFATGLDKKTISESQNDAAGGARADLLLLKDKRLMIANEDEATLSCGKLCQITGGDVITARNLYSGDYQKFIPKMRIAVLINNDPKFDKWNEALDSRSFFQSWNTIFAPADELKDKKGDKDFLCYRPKIYDLEEKFKSPIFQSCFAYWIIEGAKNFIKNRITVASLPKSIKKTSIVFQTTVEYSVKKFVDECCKKVPGAKVLATNFNQEYKSFCKENRIKPLTALSCEKIMDEMGLTHTKDGKGTRYYNNIEFK